MAGKTKREIRREGLAVRESLDKTIWKESSRQIGAKLTKHPLFTAAEHILCYVSYKREVETVELLKYCLSTGKYVYCPRVAGKDMEFYCIFSTGELESGFYGIPEPPGREDRLYHRAEEIRKRSLIVIPGAVFDIQHHRIGYGGGYYDRFLEKVPGIATVALAFSFQIQEAIPFDTHDICPQVIITEKGEV